MALSSKITAILTDWVNSQPLTNPVMCLGHRPLMVRVNLFKEISTSSQRQEIRDWYHLKENLYKVGGERQRIKQAEALLWRDRVEDAIALFDNCHSRQAITGLTQLAHGDKCSRPNPITVTRPLRLQVDKQSKMLY